MTTTESSTYTPETGDRYFIPEKMRAIVYDHYGDPERLHLSEKKTPRRFPGSIVIRVFAAGVNPIDARLRSGEAKWLLPGGFPRIPGYDVAGEIVDVASDIGLQVGDRVLAFLDSIYGGGYAEYAKCSVSSVAKIPDQLSYEEAAALPLAGSTALQGLRDKGKIAQGQRVLINGASGGVGAFAVQIARAYGCSVTGVASGKHREFVLKLGADEFIDYEHQDFAESRYGWNLIFDAAGKRSFREVRSVLNHGGHFVTTEPSARSAVNTLMSKLASRHGAMLLARPRDTDLRELVRLVEDSQVQVELADVLPIDQAAEAHRRLAAGGHCGKFVLRVQETPEQTLAPKEPVSEC